MPSRKIVQNTMYFFEKAKPGIPEMIKLKEWTFLNQKRAKQISSSPIMANVTYEGTPVYIERVNDITGTAYIHSLDMPGMRKEVFISELTEEQ